MVCDCVLGAQCHAVIGSCFDSEDHNQHALVGGDHQSPCQGTVFTVTINSQQGISASPCSDQHSTLFRCHHAGASVHWVPVLTTLLDSGSTHNFIDTSVAACIEIPLQSDADIQVAVVNGNHIPSPGRCTNITIDIVGEPFVMTCHELALGSFNMVLSVQWLESLGLILWISAIAHWRSCGTDIESFGQRLHHQPR
jgi:hypothetical protein